MYERIQKIGNYLKKEKENKEIYFNEEINNKFKIFKNWLLENGAIFDNIIEFPVINNHLLKIQCKSKENINENESFLMIPKNLIIISNDLEYLEKYIKEIKEEIPEKDLPILCLALYLYLEKKDENSFYKPYIDIIFIEKENIFDLLNKDNLNKLNDDLSVKSIEKMFNNINDIYELIKQCKKFSGIKKEEFIEYYIKVISRKIKLNNDYALVPLVDLFYSDNSINLKYEIYDSENMIFKYTSNINNKSNLKNNLYMTKAKYSLPFNKVSYNKLIPFKVEYNDEEEEEEEEENQKKIQINNNDYFSVAVSKNNKILKNNIICNNNDLCNKKLLKYKGYCLLYNKNDYLSIKIIFKRGDILIDRYLENIFKENYETKNDDPINNDIKIKIYFNYISSDLLKYFRFYYFYEVEKDAKKYFKYKYNLDIEISIITSSIKFLESKLKSMEDNFAFENDFKCLENEIFNNNGQKNCLKENIIKLFINLISTLKYLL